MSRATQPYRRSTDIGRPLGGALTAMLAGRTAFGQNPADQQRAFQRAMNVGPLGGLAAMLRR